MWSIGGISEILSRRIVGGSSPVTRVVIVVIVMVLMLSVFVIDDLRRMRFFQIHPKLDNVEDQGDDSDEEELELEVR